VVGYDVGTMYLRTTRSKGHEYLSLAHNERDPQSGQSGAKILYNFGRLDQVDKEQLSRLVRSISRFLEPEEAKELLEEVGLESPLFLGAKKLGVPHLLGGVWRRLGLDVAFKRLLSERQFSTPVERLLFAMVANRALDPGSKLDLEHWVAEEAYVDGLPEVEVHQLYRAMDFLLSAHDEIQREVFYQVSNLFNLEVDLIFVDTTTVYFEIDGEDQDDEEKGVEGFRKRGHNKDSRPNQAQAVIAFAVTRDGIPVRCWVFPGNRADVSLVEEVKRDLNSWKLGRIVLVMNTGFNSEENRRTLQGAGDAYIIGEKLRLGPKGKLPEALSRPGRYQRLTNGLRIKEVTTNSGSVTARRFVIVHNPGEAERDKAKRDDIVQEVERRLAGLNQLGGKEHTKAVCDLRAHKTFGRYIRQTKTGKLLLNKAKITAEEKLDGKFLVSTSDSDLTAEDVALGYKQLFEIERVNRDLKHTVDVRPVYHRNRERIEAHVLICWLALLLIRIIETESGISWHQIKKNFSNLQAGIHDTKHGPVIQSNPLKSEQKRVLDAVHVKPPARYLHIPTPQNQ
jgi:transposase